MKPIPIIAALVVLTGAGVAASVWMRSQPDVQVAAAPAASSTTRVQADPPALVSDPSASASASAPASASASAIPAASRGASSEPSGRLQPPAILDFGGRTTPTPIDANSATRAIADAAASHSRPELFSLGIAAPPFDKNAYEKDPDAYCALAMPSRCFQAAQPSKTVPALVPVGPTLRHIDQSGGCELQVKTLPGMPVSLTSLDLGAFSNGLTAITVRADEHGIARAAFVAGPGTINDVHILAASPVASGQVRYVVNVRPSALANRAPL